MIELLITNFENKGQELEQRQLLSVANVTRAALSVEACKRNWLISLNLVFERIVLR